MARVQAHEVEHRTIGQPGLPSPGGFNRRGFIAAARRRGHRRPGRAGPGATGPVAPPSTVTSPPRDFGPGGAPNVYFWDPDVIAVDPSFNGLAQPNAPIQRLWTGALWAEGPAWNGVGRYPGLERHPEQPADALDRGRRPCQRVPHAVEQQQRQHLRLPGPADLLRAPDPARRPLRARRLDHGPRRLLQRQAAQLAQRRGPPSGRQHLVHRPALWRAALRRHARRRRRAEQPAGQAQQPGRPAGRGQRRQAGAADPGLSLGPERPARRGDRRRQGARTPTACASPTTTRGCTSPARAGPGDIGGKGDDPRPRRRLGQQAVEPAGCSPTAWSTGSSAAPTACAATSTATCGPRATPAATWATAASPCGRPEAKLLGRIRIPEICGNICFGGPKRNRLFMAGSQSLYAVYTATQGAPRARQGHPVSRVGARYLLFSRNGVSPPPHAPARAGEIVVFESAAYPARSTVAPGRAAEYRISAPSEEWRHAHPRAACFANACRTMGKWSP